jgi:hypothetical protein
MRGAVESLGGFRLGCAGLGLALGFFGRAVVGRVAVTRARARGDAGEHEQHGDDSRGHCRALPRGATILNMHELTDMEFATRRPIVSLIALLVLGILIGICDSPAKAQPWSQDLRPGNR